MIAEFAMNDGTQAACKTDGSGTVPARASFERLIRKLQVRGCEGRPGGSIKTCGALAAAAPAGGLPLTLQSVAACRAALSGTPLHARTATAAAAPQALPNRPAVIVMDAYSFVRGAVGSYLKVGQRAGVAAAFA